MISPGVSFGFGKINSGTRYVILSAALAAELPPLVGCCGCSYCTSLATGGSSIIKSASDKVLSILLRAFLVFNVLYSDTS